MSCYNLPARVGDYNARFLDVFEETNKMKENAVAVIIT